MNGEARKPEVGGDEAGGLEALLKVDGKGRIEDSSSMEQSVERKKKRRTLYSFRVKGNNEMFSS